MYVGLIIIAIMLPVTPPVHRHRNGECCCTSSSNSSQGWNGDIDGGQNDTLGSVTRPRTRSVCDML